MAYHSTVATRAAKQERTAALLGSAREIVAAEGFGAASVKAIADRAGVSAGTVYTYFADRDALLVSVFRRAATVELTAVRNAVTVAGELPGSVRAAREITALVTTFAERAVRARRLAWAMLVEPVGVLVEAERLEFRRAYADILIDIVARGVCAGELPHQDPSIAGPALVGLIGEALIGPLSMLDGEGTAAGEVAESVIELCLRAVGGEQ